MEIVGHYHVYFDGPDGINRVGSTMQTHRSAKTDFERWVERVRDPEPGRYLLLLAVPGLDTKLLSFTVTKSGWKVS